jgi:hypothetical protein
MTQSNEQANGARGARGLGVSPSEARAGGVPHGTRWLVGLCVVTACSWARALATGSLKVDENAPGAIVGSVLFLALLGGYWLMVSAWRHMLDSPPSDPRRLAYAGLAIASLMLPMLSNDVFSLFVYGSVAGSGHDLYTTAAWLPSSPFYGLMGQMWNSTVCVYGPTTLIATLPASVAGQSPLLALVLLRATWLVPTILVMEVSLRQLRDRPFFHAMVWLNPMWLIEGPGQLHTDMLGLVAITGGILLQLRGKHLRGWVAYAVAAVGKYSFVFTGLWFWLFGAKSTPDRGMRFFALAGFVMGVGVLSFSLFWQGPKTVTEPIHALSAMNPGGSIVEFGGHVVRLLEGHGIASPDLPAKAAVALERADKASIWLVLTLLTRAAALGIALRVLYVLLRRADPADPPPPIALGTGVLVVAVLTLASHRFQSWYLLAALPFFGLECTPAWQRWWVAVVGLAVTITFIQVLPKTAFLLSVWAVISNTGTILVFLMSLKARYWSFAEPRPPASVDDARREATAPGAPAWQRAGS